jgi:hypothetical protein
MQKEYVSGVDGVCGVADTRVSLDSSKFAKGCRPRAWWKAIRLKPGTSARRPCILPGNQEEIDAYLAEGLRAAQAQHEQSRHTNAELIAKLQRARHASQISG